jgi:NTE family protein
MVEISACSAPRPFANVAALVRCALVVAGALAGLSIAGPCTAQPVVAVRPADGTASAPATAARPRVGLVLSGGGARGFAHIGVLRVLRELRVPIDVVTGTSMGSIIGGLYAAGYTDEELDKVVRGTDWDAIFNNRPPRKELDWRRKEDDYKNLSNFELGIVDGGLTLPRGLAGTQQLEFFLRSLSAPGKRVRNLDQLPVPFATIGTDLESGKRVLLQKDISLSTAMRASMSVPGVFPPVEVGGRLLVDGGVVDNLPIEAARAMGAQVIIAVNVGTPLLPRDKLNDVVNVAGQLILMMGLENVERSIASLRPADVLITPDLADLGSSDFVKGEAIVAAGEAAARAVADRLARFGVATAGFEAHEAQRTRLVRSEKPVQVDEVQVAGTRTVNPKVLEAQARDLTGRELTATEIAPTLDRIYSSGDFEVVSYSLVEAGGRTTLLIMPFEKSWGYNVLRVGGNVQTNLDDDNTFNLLLAHSWRWMNRFGAEWRNEIQIGHTRRLMTEWYQPLGVGSRWFALSRIEATRSETDLYLRDILLTRFEMRQESVDLMLGREVPQLGTLRLGVGHSHVRRNALIGLPFAASSDVVNSAQVGWRSDTLDSVLFPRRGHLLDLRYRRYDRTVELVGGRQAFSVETILPLSWDRYTANLRVAGGTSSIEGRFQLGGLFNLTGTRTGLVAGDRGLLVRGLFYRNVSDLVSVRTPLFAGFSLEAGGAVWRGESLGSDDLRKAGSLFLSAETYFGPVFLALGRTFGGSSGVYLYWGRPQ